MTARVPRWAMVLMLAALALTLSIGVAGDLGYIWLPAFTVNLLSSMTAFSASGLFVSLLVNRYVRRRYWGVELNRRVGASILLEQAASDMASVLQVELVPSANSEGLRGSVAERTVSDLLAALQTRAAELDDAGSAGMMAKLCPAPLRRVDLSWMNDLGSRIETRLAFVSDAQLLHTTDRLDEKLARLASDYATWEQTARPSDYRTLLRTASTSATAMAAVMHWLLSAPERRMQELVREGLRDSEATTRRASRR